MNIVNPIKEVADIQKLVNATHGRDQLLVRIGLNSSLRISDILALKVGDVRNQTRYITKEQKTGKRKEIKWNAAVQSAATELVPEDAQDGDWLFPSKRDASKALDRTNANRLLKAAAKRSGIDKRYNIGTHSLRKTFAYHRYINGMELPLIMKMLNHSNFNETLAYLGIDQSNIDAGYDDLCL